MSLNISSRLKTPKKNELMKSHSQAQLLANKLRSDGVMNTVESVMQVVDQVAAILASNINDPNMRESISNLCQHMKIYGSYIEILYADQLNHAFNIFRDKAQEDTRVDQVSRLHLLELIELRAKGWKGTEGMNQYYRKRANQFIQNNVMNESTNSLNDALSSLSMSASTISTTPAPPTLNAGEVLKSSGKFAKPTRIPGKKYCKDEVVIRNADSGKVMGIKGRRVHMIEELSETIISFQRVNPGAKERLVQITGANEESINHAKQLIEDTIRRNASPIREHEIAIGGSAMTASSSSINSSASDDSALPSSARASRALMHSLSVNDASIGEYKYTVVVGGSTIKISGDNLDLVRTSKLILDEYFSGEPVNDVTFFSFDSLPQSGASTNDLTEAPLSPPVSPPLQADKIDNNGSNKDDLADGKLRMRKPRVSIEEIIQGTYMESEEKKVEKLIYSIEYLALLAISPVCLQPPRDWDKITNEFPSIVRQVIEYFNAKQYLQDRQKESSCVLSAEEFEEGEV